MKLFVLAILGFSLNAGEAVKDSIATLEHLLVNFNTSLSVNAFVCWEDGEILSASGA
jgi:hypothetical protein